MFGLRRTWNSRVGAPSVGDVGDAGDALEDGQEVVRHVVGHHVEADALRGKAELDDGRGVGIEGLDRRRVDARRELLDGRGHLRRHLIRVGVLVAALVEETMTMLEPVWLEELISVMPLMVETVFSMTWVICWSTTEGVAPG